MAIYAILDLMYSWSEYEVFCEYCGNRIDAEVDEKCPNCGASYKKNKSFIELEKTEFNKIN